MVVRLTSFKSDGVISRFNNATESTYNILNSTLSTSLEFLFTISGLNLHVIDTISFDLFFSSSGNYRFEIRRDDTLIKSMLKDISGMRYSTDFTTERELESSDSFILTYIVSNNNNVDVDYGLYNFTISLFDLPKEYKVSFSGPLTGRNASSITCSVLELNKGVQAVSFSKDPTKKFDLTDDSVEGRMYLRENGIFVDGYQYGVNAIATSEISGIVKLSDSLFEIDDEDGGIIPPSDVGVAATPQLVYNTLATAKLYVDDSIDPINTAINSILATLDGIDAPLIINIEDEEGEISGLGDTLTFSSDFEQIDNKLYIKWLNLT